MNAVNLLPPDLRRGTGAPARSGLGVYVVLGVLAAAVLLVAATTVVKGRVSDRETQLAQAETEAAQAEQQAAAISHYKQLAAQTSSRVGGVESVAAARVQWAPALTQVAQTVGTKVAFSTLTASTSTASSGAGGALRGSIDAPALEVVGCAENHPAVARLMTRFRAMNGVQRVALATSEKEAKPASAAASDGAGSGSSGAGSSASSSDSDCTDHGKLPAKFSLVIWLEKSAAATAAATAAGTSTGATTSASTPATGESK